ncbi:hypothetical protein POM88_042823 [Heracleum sosnowskyi]|uniref:Secreted protein n=1 Tax=Heracleum sosnowskyi TaxID=360622 RepID=A0AAD8MC17_9APIA|nr:hypothetical protein POM88_042823 [Heracleum sosnowskyi]
MNLMVLVWYAGLLCVHTLCHATVEWLYLLSTVERPFVVAWGNCDALVTVFCGDGDMLLWLKMWVLLGVVEIDRVMALRLGGRRRSFVDNRGNWIDLKCVHNLCHATVEWLYLLSTVERPFGMV